MLEFLPWLISVLTVVFILWFSKRQNPLIKKFLDWVPAILLAYLIPAAASSLLGYDFSQAEIHGWSKRFVIPLAILSVMASMSLGQLKSIGWKPIIVFALGSLWIAVFPVIYLLFLEDSTVLQEFYLKEEYWKGLPPVVGSWIGGSTSQLVLKEVVECPENVFLTILVLDNILVNIWTLLMFQTIKGSTKLNSLFRIRGGEPPAEIKAQEKKALSPVWCLLVFALVILGVDRLISDFILQVVVLSVIGLLLGNAIRSWNIRFSLRLGELAILLVMAILGLKLRFELISFNENLISFLLLWLGGHFLFMLLGAKLLNTNVAWVSIASMANVGGIATAPAVTAAYKKEWMPHAIVLAILSMATGTFWGLLTIYLLRTWVIP